MCKVVISTSYLGFWPSNEVITLYIKTSKTNTSGRWSIFDVPRDDPLLIRIIESIGLKRAGTAYSKLKIVTLPDDVGEWEIIDDDGKEHVVEKQRRRWD
jgi:hypothetical protein